MSKTVRDEIWVGCLLVLLTALLIAFQYLTLSKFSAVPPGTGLATLQEWSQYARGRIGLSWRDAALAIAMVSVFGAIISLEVRGRQPLA